MLTARELEPYHIFERTNAELGLDLRDSTVKDLAEATHEIYFASPTATPPVAGDEGPAGDTQPA